LNKLQARPWHWKVCGQSQGFKWNSEKFGGRPLYSFALHMPWEPQLLCAELQFSITINDDYSSDFHCEVVPSHSLSLSQACWCEFSGKRVPISRLIGVSNPSHNRRRQTPCIVLALLRWVTSVHIKDWNERPNICFIHLSRPVSMSMLLVQSFSNVFSLKIPRMTWFPLSCYSFLIHLIFFVDFLCRLLRRVSCTSIVSRAFLFRPNFSLEGILSFLTDLVCRKCSKGNSSRNVCNSSILLALFIDKC
jgi:hypothetical protein